MKKVLIANRGEIAVRIARACRDYGVASVAVYADTDAEALFVRLADEAYGLGGMLASETYLDIAKLIGAARRAGADAVHPGYGFLSERAEFARAVMDAGLTWIGPSPDVIAALGDKVEARRIAAGAGAPLVAGSDGPVKNAAEAIAFAEKHGLPVAIKAVHGGGGRGLKVARRLDEIGELLESARREAKAAFGRDECYVERFLDRPRHIEAQILGDNFGNMVVVGTRDCSLQRRNQKLVEEAPAPFLADEQRTAIHAAAKSICRAAGYTGAGTIEFLLGAEGALSFLEVNTRLQVEHPITEETAGVDLVVEQFRIADGLPLSITETPVPRAHSIEFRINAEDPGRGFLPAPGRISAFAAPSGPGVRLDTGVEAGSAVPGAFDSLLAKLIVTGPTRAQALSRARRALMEFRIEGVPTVLPFHRAVIESEDFKGAGGFKVHTRWIETEFADMPEAAKRPEYTAEPNLLRMPVEIDGRRHELAIPAALLANFRAPSETGTPRQAHAPAAAGALVASITGTLRAWKIAGGQRVREGDVVAVLEAMKMEIQVTAPRDGALRRILEEGATVEAGAAIGNIDA